MDEATMVSAESGYMWFEDFFGKEIL